MNAQVQWAFADTRSIAAEADAAVKYFAAGLLSRAGTLRRLGFSEDEIAAEMASGTSPTQTITPTLIGPQNATQGQE